MSGEAPVGTLYALLLGPPLALGILPQLGAAFHLNPAPPLAFTALAVLLPLGSVAAIRLAARAAS